MSKNNSAYSLLASQLPIEKIRMHSTPAKNENIQNESTLPSPSFAFLVDNWKHVRIPNVEENRTNESTTTPWSLKGSNLNKPEKQPAHEGMNMKQEQPDECSSFLERRTKRKKYVCKTKNDTGM